MDEFLYIVSSIRGIKFAIGLLISLILILMYLIFFQKKINKQSSKQINDFRKSKKYIKELYIELNDINEQLHYFAFKSKWKKKVVRDFNALFNSKHSKELKKHLKSQITYKVYRRHSYKKIMTIVQHNIEVFSKYRNEKIDCKSSSMGEYYYIVQLESWRYIEKLSKIKKYCDIAVQNSLILTGSAGNGKTNLLCNFVEIVSKNNNPCVFFNSKDIKKDCTEFFGDYISNPKLKNFWKTLLTVYLFFTRKRLFVVVDAINENDTPLFQDSLGKFNDTLSKFKKISIVYSCRSEYFETRYQKLFSNCKYEPYQVTIQGNKYNMRAKEKLLATYKSFFKCNVTLSESAKNKLFNSLILMRMFFEVNENTSPKFISELHNAEIYIKYVDNLCEQVKPLDLNPILNEIAQIMTNSFNFSEVKMSELNLSSTNIELFKNALDNNLLISRNIKKSEKLITEKNHETIYFVLDELRDFTIARYWLWICEEKNDYNFYFDAVDRLYKDRMSPLEGILKYAYYY